MIYTFDKKQNILRALDENNFLTAELTFKINEATTFSFTATPEYELTDKEKYVALPHPLDQTKFIMLRLISRTDNKDDIEYTAYEYAYQELSTSGYIKDTRPQNSNALTLMTKALDGSGWSVGRTTVAGTATTNFYYIDYLSAVSKVVDLLGGEIVFYVEITGNKITGRYMDYLFRQGIDTSKVFADGSNLLSVARKKQSDSIYTAILPRGKGEQVSDGGGNEPDGYGRRIDIKDVVWSTANRKPLNKPAGSFILEDPQATAEYGQANGNARLLIQNFDEVDDPNVLIQQAYNTLMTMNHQLIEYSATVSDVGTLSLGDTVLIMHGQRNLSYKTRVFQVKYDLLHSENTELSLGDNLSSNNITSQINAIRSSIQTNSNQQAWTVSQFGRPSTTFGATQPTAPKMGDTWFKSLPDGNVEIWHYNGTIWVKVITPTTGEEIAKAVDDAVAQAKDHTDEVKQGLSSDIATANSQAESLASTAEANAKSEATSLFSTAKDALEEAKKNLQNDIDESKGNIVEMNKTLTGFDGTLQRVQNAVNGLGQVNQLFNTEFTPDLQGWTLSADTGSKAPYKSGFDNNALANMIGFNTVNANANTLATLRQDLTIGNASGGYVSLSWQAWAPTFANYANLWVRFYDSSGTQLSQQVKQWTPQKSDGSVIPGLWTRQKFEGIAIPSGAVMVSVFFQAREGINAYLIRPMLVFGSTVGAYVQGNYNNNDALAKVKLTADQASLDLSTYTKDADGRIKKAQSGIEANATAITKKVSQTDYDKKTGELSNKLNTTTDTADGTKQALSDYKEYANGNISGVASDLRKVAGEVSLKLSKTDYDDSQSILNTSLSQWKADYDGWTGTVSKLSNTVNNLGQVNQLMNTEFTPDLEGWILSAFNGSNAPYKSGFDKNVQANMVGFNTTNSPATSIATLRQDVVIGQASGGFVSLSWQAWAPTFANYANLWVRFYDNNNQQLDQQLKQWTPQKSDGSVVGGLWTRQKFEGIAIPSGSVKISVFFQAREGINAYLVRPMLVFSETIGAYVAGNYNNNAALAQVKITADSISNFVRDSSGNISSDFQTALSRTSIITGSTLASSIETQTATQISSALTDNNGKIISLINQDSSGVQIAGKNIVLDGNTTVTGDFYAKGGNFKNLNASNLTVGTLNGNQVNITNLNASNIVSGAISGANLDINLNTGQVVFQHGRIYNDDNNYKGIDINIDQSYISTRDFLGYSTLANGGFYLSQTRLNDSGYKPYFSIDNNNTPFGTLGALLLGTNGVAIATEGNSMPTVIGGEIYNGLLVTKGKQTVVAGASNGVMISGGKEFDNTSPFVNVGATNSITGTGGDRVQVYAKYFHLPLQWSTTASNAANVFIGLDGAIVRSSSSSKYKLDIEYEQQAETANRLLTIDPATWHDKFESKQLDKFHEIGVDPERTIDMSNRRYYGIIAEDLVKAGLEHLVSRNVETGEVEGVEYSKIGLALIPIIRDLRNRLNDQYVEIERLKEKIK